MKVFALLPIVAMILLSATYPQTLSKDSLNDDWIHRTTLPLISVNGLLPIKHQNNFSSEFGYLKYRTEVKAESGGSTFGTDREAVDVAKSFLKEYFGKLPFELRVGSIDHSASGRPAPQSPDDIGFTIAFESLYHGIELANCGAVVYIRHKTVESASIDFVNPSPIPQSEHKLIDKKRALSIWVQKVKEYEGEEPIQLASPVLHYVWSPEDNKILDARESIFRPNWSIGGGLYIDAFTGKLWRND